MLFHDKRHPTDLGAPEIEAFLNHLGTDQHVSASTQNQALAALLFLYVHVLSRPFGELRNLTRAKQPKRLPFALTQDEVSQVFDKMSGVTLLMASLLYGAGLPGTRTSARR